VRETWYVLENGENADPREVARDKAGVLRNKKGVAVAIGDHGNPRTSGVEVDEPKPAKSRQVKAGGDKDDPNYKTR
jgi:hypothetical protein